MKKKITFVLNLPWTFVGIIFSLLSVPYILSFSHEPRALIVTVKSFWWLSWIGPAKRVRAFAIGNVVVLGNIIDERDISHELVHVEQMEREPFVHPFLYWIEMLRFGYRNNIYEKEAYKRARNVLTRT